jgi:hypothetical protein
LAPSQAELKRAVSTAYYAMFRYVSQNCADEIAGGGMKPLSRAAAQVYRSLDHRDITAACEKARNARFGFPKEIFDFAVLFLEMHKSRQKADYDPVSIFVPQQVQSKISNIEDAFREHAIASRDDRRAFAILVAVKAPPRSRG